MVKTILYKRTIALGTSTWYNFRKDLRRSEPIVVIAVDLGGGRKEAVKTGGRIHNITKKNAERDLLYVQPTNPHLHEATWMNTAFRGLGCL